MAWRNSVPTLPVLMQTRMNCNTMHKEDAKRYYDALPDYVREQIDTRPAGVNSLASLKGYAENLTRGDD